MKLNAAQKYYRQRSITPTSSFTYNKSQNPSPQTNAGFRPCYLGSLECLRRSITRPKVMPVHRDQHVDRTETIGQTSTMFRNKLRLPRGKTNQGVISAKRSHPRDGICVTFVDTSCPGRRSGNSTALLPLSAITPTAQGIRYSNHSMVGLLRGAVERQIKVIDGYCNSISKWRWSAIFKY